MNLPPRRHGEWLAERDRLVHLINTPGAISDPEAELLSERILLLEEMLSTEVPSTLLELHAQLAFAAGVVRDRYVNTPLSAALKSALSGAERLVAAEDRRCA